MTGHQHDRAESPGDPNWWKALDLLVWCAVVVIAVIGIELLVGAILRRRVVQAFERVTRAAAPPPTVIDGEATTS